MAGKKGMVRAVPGRTARQQAWQSMQIFGEFTFDDIISTSNIKLSNLRKYVTALRRYGYIEEVGLTGKVGQLHTRKVFELMKDTGIHCPLPYSDKGLRDLNTGEIFEPEEDDK